MLTSIVATKKPANSFIVIPTHYILSSTTESNKHH